MSKILVIEDEDAVRENIIELLTEEEYEVIGAPTGEEGVQLVWKEMPDLIICDILMPGLDGYGVLAKIGKDVRLANIPFLFLTARISRDDMRKGMGLGADDYITKPFSRNDLLQAITSRLGRIQNLQSFTQQKMYALQKNVASGLPHELLTPLSVTMSYSELLVDRAGELSTEDIRGLAQDIYRSTQRVVNLVENYLLFSDLYAILADPTLRRKFERLDCLEVRPLLLEIAEEKARDAGREIDLEADVHPGSLPIFEAHLVKIGEELIANALRTSRKGSPIHLEGELLPAAGIYRLKVSDQGPGMTPDQIRSITHFMPVDRQFTPGDELGLSLYLVKMLCDLYHGSIKIFSQAQKGTRVEVSLPIQTFML